MAGVWPNLDASDLETRVRTYLNEASANFYTQAEIWSWLSFAVKDIAQKSLCVRRAIDAVTVSGTRTVSTTAYKVMYVEYIPSTGRPFMLSKIDPLRLGHYPLQQGANHPQYWYEFSDTIGIEPLPDAIYNLRLYIADIPKMIITYQTDYSSGWTAGTGWSAGTTAVHTGSSGDLTYSTASLTPSVNHTISFLVSGVTAGATITPYIGTTAGIAISSNGYHMQNIIAPSGTPSFLFRSVGTISVDNTTILTEADYSSVSDQTELPTAWQHLLALYATYCGLMKDRRYQNAQLLENIYNNEIVYLRYNIVENIPNGLNDIKYL
jgi:hypothetical protein